MTLTLSPQQSAVRDFITDGEGSANVIARAGTGKTLTLVHGAIKSIVDNRLGNVAIMAFNKAAATEFQERIERLGSGYGKPTVEAGTVHSFGYAAIRKWAGKRRLNVWNGKCFKITKALAEADAIDTDDSIYTVERHSILKLVSLAKQTGIGFVQSLDDAGAWQALMDKHSIEPNQDIGADTIIRAAITVLRESIDLNGVQIDFDDMIFAPLYHNMSLNQFDWVLIDEAQDTNPARRALALKMLKSDGRMIAVGDDRQAIYGFTGADADALDLIADEVDAVTLPLTMTYRCPKSVVRQANRIVPDLDAHSDAPEGIVRSIKYRGEDKTCFFQTEQLSAADGILCRNVAPMMELAYALLADGQACRIEGRDIADGLIKLATRFKTDSLSTLVDELNEWRDREVQKWQAKERYNLAQSAEDRATALIYLSNSLMQDGKHEVSDLTAWIKDLFNDKKKGVITMTTIHKAKGREWERVFLLHRNKTIPSRWAKKAWEQEQEANLEYVAITRAMSELIYVDD